MATKQSKTKKPSALSVQDDLNAVLPQLLGNSLRVALDTAEDLITGSPVPDQGEIPMISETVGDCLEKAQLIVSLAQFITKKLDPGAIKSEIRRRTKK